MSGVRSFSPRALDPRPRNSPGAFVRVRSSAYFALADLSRETASGRGLPLSRDRPLRLGRACVWARETRHARSGASRDPPGHFRIYPSRETAEIGRYPSQETAADFELRPRKSSRWVPLATPIDAHFSFSTSPSRKTSESPLESRRITPLEKPRALARKRCQMDTRRVLTAYRKPPVGFPMAPSDLTSGDLELRSRSCHFSKSATVYPTVAKNRVPVWSGLEMFCAKFQSNRTCICWFMEVFVLTYYPCGRQLH